MRNERETTGPIDALLRQTSRRAADDWDTLPPLLDACMAGNRDAWDRFLRRFLKLIVKTIKKSFVRNGNTPLSQDQEAVYEVLHRVIQRLMLSGIPPKIAPFALPEWLAAVARTQTVAHLRQQKTRMRILGKMEARDTDSMDRALGPEGAMTLGETICAMDPAEGEERKRNLDLEALVLAKIEKADTRSRLVMRVLMMFYLELGPSDIQEIACLRGVPVEQVAKDVEALKGVLAGRERQRLRARDLADISFYRLERLEKACSGVAAGEDRGGHGVPESLQERDAERERHRALVTRARAIVRPRIREIGALLGLPGKDKTCAQVLRVDIMKMRRHLKRSIEESGVASL